MIDEYGSLAGFFWPHATFDDRGRRTRSRRSRATSTMLSKQLKKLRLVVRRARPPIYAFMQAMGLVNDHLDGCWVREPASVAPARRRHGRSWVEVRP